MASTVVLLQNHLNGNGSYHRKSELPECTSEFLRPDNYRNDTYFETDEDLEQLHPHVPAKKLKCDGSKGKPEVVGSTTKGVSRAILAGKYLLQFEDNVAERQSDSGNPNNSISSAKNTPIQLGPTKVPLKCLKLATKEIMQCKITARDDRGVSTLAAHQRLGECADFINPISELIVTPKYFCLISPMTYGSLHSYVYSKSKLKEEEAKHFFKQMVSIVEFCHSRGIILRDLKMGRFVFADKERTILKLDSLEDVAVLPKPDTDDDSLNDHHGCPNYVSPDKAECVMKAGTSYSGKASDVWALGISLYTMLAGQYPFNDTECQRLLYKIRNCHQYTMVEGISPLLKSLIRCLLVKNPRDRPSCTELLTHPWLKYSEIQRAVSAPLIRSRIRDGETTEGESRAKRMRFNDDQVVPGSAD